MRLRLLILLVFPLFASCDQMLLGDDEPVISLEQNLKTPEVLNDGWDVASLSSQDLDEQEIHRLVTFIQGNPNNIHSLLIVRNNKLVLESYFTGWHRDRVHALRSVSKTFVSTLTGIAVDKGYFTVDQKVADLLPDYAGLMDDEMKEIRVSHLLTMTSGIKWDEKTFPGEDYRNDESAFDRSDRRFEFLFGKEMAAGPGEEFEYNSALPVVESAIIKKTTGIHAHIFAEDNFFKPLGITNYYWRTHPNDGYVAAIGPLFLTPRDMAKLGQLFLDSGTWKGQRIISKQWVKDATTTFKGDEEAGEGYGYHWWITRYTVGDKEYKVFSARGSGGQYIFVTPALNSVVVFTSGNYPPRNQSIAVRMFMNTIIPAMTE